MKQIYIGSPFEKEFFAIVKKLVNDPYGCYAISEYERQRCKMIKAVSWLQKFYDGDLGWHEAKAIIETYIIPPCANPTVTKGVLTYFVGFDSQGHAITNDVPAKQVGGWICSKNNKMICPAFTKDKGSSFRKL